MDEMACVIVLEDVATDCHSGYSLLLVQGKSRVKEGGSRRCRERGGNRRDVRRLHEILPLIVINKVQTNVLSFNLQPGLAAGISRDCMGRLSLGKI